MAIARHPDRGCRRGRALGHARPPPWVRSVTPEERPTAVGGAALAAEGSGSGPRRNRRGSGASCRSPSWRSSSTTRCYFVLNGNRAKSPSATTSSSPSAHGSLRRRHSSAPPSRKLSTGGGRAPGGLDRQRRLTAWRPAAVAVVPAGGSGAVCWRLALTAPATWLRPADPQGTRGPGPRRSSAGRVAVALLERQPAAAVVVRAGGGRQGCRSGTRVSPTWAYRPFLTVPKIWRSSLALIAGASLRRGSPLTPCLPITRYGPSVAPRPLHPGAIASAQSVGTLSDRSDTHHRSDGSGGT